MFYSSTGDVENNIAQNALNFRSRRETIKTHPKNRDISLTGCNSQAYSSMYSFGTNIKRTSTEGQLQAYQKSHIMIELW